MQQSFSPKIVETIDYIKDGNNYCGITQSFWTLHFETSTLVSSARLVIRSQMCLEMNEEVDYLVSKLHS